MDIKMKIDNLPTHIKEMRNFIDISKVFNNSSLICEQEIEIPNNIKKINEVVDVLEDIGLEKLSLLFSDRSHAEIVLDSCVIFKKKLIEQDFHTAQKIGEAFVKLFEKISTDKFDLIRIDEEQRSIFTGNFKLLFESSNKTEINKESNIKELLDDIYNLIENWESYTESDDTLADFAEGIETGLMKAAMELKEILNKFLARKSTGDRGIK